VLDSGASVSCVHPRVFREFLQEASFERMPNEHATIIGANNQVIDCPERVVFEFLVDKARIKHEFFVIPSLPYDVLLGFSFFQQVGARLDFQAGTFEMSSPKIKPVAIESAQPSNVIVADKKIVVPAGSRHLIHVVVPLSLEDPNQALCFVPQADTFPSCIVPVSILAKERTFVVLNSTRQAFSIHPGTVLGTVEVVDTVTPLDSIKSISDLGILVDGKPTVEHVNILEAQVAPPETSAAPPKTVEEVMLEQERQLKALLQQLHLPESLTDEERKRVHDVLRPRLAAFQLDPNRLSMTNAGVAHISTGNAAPIQQKSYRYSMMERRNLHNEQMRGTSTKYNYRVQVMYMYYYTRTR
jgi:hypothetical protein